MVTSLIKTPENQIHKLSGSLLMTRMMSKSHTGRNDGADPQAFNF